ncbi:MAG: protein-tyrosine-phosphatase, partial [Maribacter stanieri]
MTTKQITLLPKINELIQELKPDNISAERKKTLQPLIDLIQDKTANNQEIRLNFICTHNSRRSHLSQVWAQTLAYHFGIKNVFCYSGGTEATALFPMVAETLKNTGF